MLENYINCINTALTRLTSFRPHILIDAEAYRVTAFEGGPLVIRNPTLMNGPLAGNIITEPADSYPSRSYTIRC